MAVVGASAAGLAASWAAAGEGADVLLLEGRARIGEPPAPASLAFDLLWEAPIRPSPDAVRRRHRGLAVRSPSGACLEVEAPLSILDRGRFDEELAAEAQRRGARVETGVAGLALGPERTLIAQGLVVRPKVIVFADGARTLAAGLLATQRSPGDLAWGAQLAFEREGAAREERVTLTLGSHALGGRSQLNPLEGDRWTHWTFYRGSPADAEARARAALALDARLRGWPASVADEARFAGVAPDPVYTLPGRLSAPGVLVAGGAGGQGGLEIGLGAGVLAGRVAAAVARGRAQPRDYERAWKRRHLAGYLLLRWATDRLARLPDAEVDRLLTPWDRRRIALEAPARGLARNPKALPSLARAALRSLF